MKKAEPHGIKEDLCASNSNLQSSIWKVFQAFGKNDIKLMQAKGIVVPL